MNDSAVLEANEAFYQAFAHRDFQAMDRLWSKESEVACIHPGWAPIFGREMVMASWQGILGNPRSPAITCRQPRAFLQGDNAFVVCFEDLGGVFLIATNSFRRETGGWKLIHHQAGPAPEAVAEEAAGEEEEDEDEQDSPPGSGRLH